MSTTTQISTGYVAIFSAVIFVLYIKCDSCVRLRVSLCRCNFWFCIVFARTECSSANIGNIKGILRHQSNFLVQLNMRVIMKSNSFLVTPLKDDVYYSAGNTRFILSICFRPLQVHSFLISNTSNARSRVELENRREKINLWKPVLDLTSPCLKFTT